MYLIITFYPNNSGDLTDEMNSAVVDHNLWSPIFDEKRKGKYVLCSLREGRSVENQFLQPDALLLPQNIEHYGNLPLGARLFLRSGVFNLVGEVEHTQRIAHSQRIDDDEDAHHHPYKKHMIFLLWEARMPRKPAKDVYRTEVWRRPDEDEVDSPLQGDRERLALVVFSWWKSSFGSSFRPSFRSWNKYVPVNHGKTEIEKACSQTLHCLGSWSFSNYMWCGKAHIDPWDRLPTTAFVSL